MGASRWSQLKGGEESSDLEPRMYENKYGRLLDPEDARPIQRPEELERDVIDSSIRPSNKEEEEAGELEKSCQPKQRCCHVARFLGE
ncbi:hypothetical protein CC1G_15373 [Coprinopsis cinerea okayama7|uniref:Uncharacterized protein n=1 Tax=Coprinopsis cinerea (strain Okayama-7 / 130 / ATCC MYA-4618 / FGSC 9003) TaxID=240176 RepID=D6RQK4_COPC7|nr:hypothetical protein CC1G_15373 [Coprinopsis cinerea okayama7\|eukprot:XP_002910095.1 hypothetical protein CC1G_15373 [Coprinopsis cinerea okayama7\